MGIGIRVSTKVASDRERVSILGGTVVYIRVIGDRIKGMVMVLNTGRMAANTLESGLIISRMEKAFLNIKMVDWRRENTSTVRKLLIFYFPHSN